MSTTLRQTITAQAQTARAASRQLATTSTAVKNAALLAMAAALDEHRADILAANAHDVSAAKAAGTKAAFVDRLALTAERLQAMSDGLRQTAMLPDPVGAVDWSSVRPNGLEIRRVRVPLGVIGIVYEARPNVTADAIALCLKSGNAVMLRGGSEALASNRVLSRLLAEAAYSVGVPRGAVQFIDSEDREAVAVLMSLRGLVDVIIPRGGSGLIRRVVRESAVPAIETGAGVCHTFIDATADPLMGVAIAVNAKTSRPSVCNAMETLLVHVGIAPTFLPLVCAALTARGCELRGCARARDLVTMNPASDDDWATEYDDLILAIKVVDSLDAAIAHINRYGTGHSETIVTNDLVNAHRFQSEVDAAAVYVNASTRFTDGFEFGLGAEIGISTQKLHARGPMGLEALTSSKCLVYGAGQVR